MDDDGQAPPPVPEPAPGDGPAPEPSAERGPEAPRGTRPMPRRFARYDPATLEATRAYVLALRAATPRIRVTWVILAANVAVFGLMVAGGVDPMAPTALDILRWGGDARDVTAGGEWWRLFTSTFVHVGLLHLAVNMYCLYVLGPLVERLLGPAGFLVAYLAAGLAGSLGSHAFGPDAVSAGASGSLFGLFGAVLAYALRLRSALPPPLRRDFLRTSMINVAVNLAFGLSVPQINTAAHVGGMVGGLVVAWPLCAPPTRAAVHARPRRAAWVALGSVLAAVLVAWALWR